MLSHTREHGHQPPTTTTHRNLSFRSVALDVALPRRASPSFVSMRLEVSVVLYKKTNQTLTTCTR